MQASLFPLLSSHRGCFLRRKKPDSNRIPLWTERLHLCSFGMAWLQVCPECKHSGKVQGQKARIKVSGFLGDRKNSNQRRSTVHSGLFLNPFHSHVSLYTQIQELTINSLFPVIIVCLFTCLLLFCANKEEERSRSGHFEHLELIQLKLSRARVHGSLQGQMQSDFAGTELMGSFY